MNAKSFQNVGSLPIRIQSTNSDEVLPTETLETPVSPDAPEPNIPKAKAMLEGVKPSWRKTPIPFPMIPNYSGIKHQIQTNKLLKKNGFLHLNNSALIVLERN